MRKSFANLPLKKPLPATTTLASMAALLFLLNLPFAAFAQKEDKNHVCREDYFKSKLSNEKEIRIKTEKQLRDCRNANPASVPAPTRPGSSPISPVNRGVPYPVPPSEQLVRDNQKLKGDNKRLRDEVTRLNSQAKGVDEELKKRGIELSGLKFEKNAAEEQVAALTKENKEITDGKNKCDTTVTVLVGKVDTLTTIVTRYDSLLEASTEMQVYAQYRTGLFSRKKVRIIPLGKDLESEVKGIDKFDAGVRWKTKKAARVRHIAIKGYTFSRYEGSPPKAVVSLRAEAMGSEEATVIDLNMQPKFDIDLLRSKPKLMTCFTIEAASDRLGKQKKGLKIKKKRKKEGENPEEAIQHFTKLIANREYVLKIECSVLGLDKSIRFYLD